MRSDNRLGAIIHAEFLQNVMYVPLGCANTDHQLVSNLPVRFASHNQIEHPEFLFGEWVEQLHGDWKRKLTGWLGFFENVIHKVGGDEAGSLQQMASLYAAVREKDTLIAFRGGQTQG